jgi:peptidoglycan/xylan/chitin deacetylase (PgdA/CDA1 family)
MPVIPAAISLAFALLLSSSPPVRKVVVTIDDLPVTSVLPLAAAQRDSITDGILSVTTRHRIPAIGFVNENKLLDSAGTVDPARVDLLRRWLDHGLELGNHTWSHPDLHRIALTEFESEVLKGEAVTRPLLAQRGKTPRYFRHPFLHTGRSVAVRDSLTQFLSDHGYRVAPVTIDNSDYIFAAAYDRARSGGDTASATRIRSTYLEYMDSVTAFYERQAVAIVGRALPQILLLHANRLNADALDGLASMLKRRGYQFVSLDEALKDRAYNSPDSYAGPAGITWLHRWAITAGVSRDVYKGEPDVPAWIATMSQADR